jgi:hypothetical protein
MAGPDLAGVGEREQPIVERAEDAARAVLLVDGQIGPRDVAHEQAVARQHGPGLRAPVLVDQRERRVLGAMARRVQRAHGHVAERELPAVVERLVLVVHPRLAVDVDGRAGRRRQPPVARDVVGVVVRLEDVLDGNAHVAGQPQVLVDVEPGVDHRADPGALVADQVRGAAEVVVDDLTEQHQRLSRCPSDIAWAILAEPSLR